MTATPHHSQAVDTARRWAPLSSSDRELPAIRDHLDDPDETTSLLRTSRDRVSQWNYPEWWFSARSAVSTFSDKNAGLLLVAASQFFFSGMNISVKWLSSLDEPIPTLELIWVRMVITYVCSVAYMCLRKIPDPILGPKGVRGLLVLRGFTGFVALAGMYFSLQHLSLSDATVLTFIAPILTGFSGAIFLKEPFSLREMFAGLCSFFGVVLIARPQFLFGNPKGDPFEAVMPEQRRLLSIAAGLLGVIGATCTYILLRAIGRRVHPLHSMMFFSLQCVLASTIGMISFQISPVIPADTLWFAMLFLIGILGSTAQVLLVMGLQRETASRATLANYTSIVFAVVFEFIVFHTTPSVLSIAGTIIIMSSAIYISLTKKTASKPTTGPTLEQPSLTSSDNDDHPRP